MRACVRGSTLSAKRNSNEHTNKGQKPVSGSDITFFRIWTNIGKNLFVSLLYKVKVYKSLIYRLLPPKKRKKYG